jgi:hypothetical protein
MNAIPDTKRLRKLEALRIVCKNLPPEDIAAQMLLEGVFTRSDIDQRIKGSRESDKIEGLFILLEKAAESGALLLLDYEWTVLPNYSVTISIVTPSSQKEYKS